MTPQQILDPLFAAAKTLAEIMLSHEPQAVRESLGAASIVALACYLMRTCPDYCRAVTA